MDGQETASGMDRPTADRGKRGRRLWTAGDKRRIVREAEKPAAVIQQVAQQNGVHPSVLQRWRRELRAERSRPGLKKAVRTVRLLPVQIHPSRQPGARSQPGRTPSVAADGNVIEVVLPTGQRITVRGTVDGVLLRTVLQELSRC